MRLTCKTAIGYCDMSIATRKNKLQKLGQLEDIEQELGIDLVTLFKALNNGVFEKDLDNNVSHTKIRGIEKYGLCAIWHSNIPECDYTLEYKDYGKTWALTKEELL